jgi:hypothetical protein
MNKKRLLTVMGGTQKYYQSVLNTFGSSVIGYWTLAESTGTVAYDYSGNVRNGTYSNVIQGQPSIGARTASSLFVPASSSTVNIYSAGLASAFSPTEGTIQFIMKVSAASVWNAASTMRQTTLQVDASNRIYISIVSSSANALSLVYVSGGTTNIATISTTSAAPIVVSLTWSKSNDRVRGFLNGVQQGANVTGLGIWAGALAGNATVISGASSAGDFGHDGWMSNYFLLNREATPEELLAVMPPLP